MVFCASLPPWPRLYPAADNSCNLRNHPSMRCGGLSRNSQKMATMKLKPSTRPMIGATTMKISVLYQPSTMMTLKPERMMAAPAKPPIRACDEEVGNAHHQVSKSQTIAPSNPAITTYWVTESMWIMPLPMVLATAVPRKKAATKLKKAAQMTASLGESTRVETTVAMLLAASWKPLRKSKIKATT